MLTYEYSEIKPAIENTHNQFYEIIRRIPKHKQQEINARLEQIAPTDIRSVLAAIADQHSLLDDDSFIHDEIFPFAALKAVLIGELSAIQFGSLMSLWGNLDTILSREQRTHTPPKFVPLFTQANDINPHAEYHLKKALQPSAHYPYLILKTPTELLNDVYEQAPNIPKSEQGFWIIKAAPAYHFETVTQRIKSLNIALLTANDDDSYEMIPNLGLQQLLLNAAFPHAVRINPVIGDSTSRDIRQGSIERYRDIALPFPGNELPSMADQIPAPSAFDFMLHDRYHAIRASRITPQETAHYVAIGDNLNIIQKRYDDVVKIITSRHAQHICQLPQVTKIIAKLSADKQHNITEQIRQKFNQENTLIYKLKKMRKSMGQLKFRLWDMERVLSGTIIDTPDKTAPEELAQIIANIGIELIGMGILPGTIEPSAYSGKKVAQALLETIKPEAATLIAVHNQIKEREKINAKSLFFLPAQPARHKAFMDAILEAPTHVAHP